MHSSKDPLHGVTLEALLNALVARYGWAEMARQVNINCFKSDPSIKSSLKFLRRTPWARKEVEAMYLASLDDDAPVEKADPWANWQKNNPYHRTPSCRAGAVKISPPTARGARWILPIFRHHRASTLDRPTLYLAHQ